MKKITLFLFLFISLQGISQFTEGFESGIPADWTVINGGDPNQTWVSGSVASGTAHSGTKVARIDYDSDLAHNDYLITKAFDVVPNLTDRLTLWARQLDNEFPEPFDILVSNTGIAEEDFIDVIATNVTPTTSWGFFTYNLSSYVGQTIYVAFRSTTTTQYQLYLDDITIDAIPQILPTCAQNVVSQPSTICGNFPTQLTWTTSPEATGYLLSVGTDTGATNIMNNQDIGYVGVYNVTNQQTGTTYYWKLTPYNAIGQALNCNVNSYTTLATSCYCTPRPNSADGYGITNVSIGTINNSTLLEPNNYGNFSSQVTTAARGSSVPVDLLFETNGYAYNVKIWIDWNNDFDFDDAGEVVFTGVSLAINAPNLVSGSIAVPSDAMLGQHRMRVAGQSYTDPFTPCYTSFFAAFEDYTLNVTPALGINTNEFSIITFFPNPVVNVLNITSEKTISNIEVYNIVGQKVTTKLVNQNQIDMTHLSAGTYLVKIFSDDKQQTVKVVKQ